MRQILSALLAAFALLFAAGAALAQQSGDVVISRGNVAPLVIAAPAFSGAAPHGDDLAGIIRNDLGGSGLFAPIDPLRYIEQKVDGGQPPNFPNWKLIGAQYLVTGVVGADPDGRLRVDFRLYDVNSNQQLTGVQFTAPEDSWRRIGHKIADAIYEKLTGAGGYFDTRIAFVSESGPKTNRRRVLTLMDQDGYNAQFPASPSDAQVFMPRFSSDGDELVYMALRDSGSQLYLLNIETARTEALGNFKGMAYGPRFSPDGSKVAFSVADHGNTDIYLADVRAGAQQRLTSDPGIDTSPSFSPDGKQMVFNSDRAGSPQLYTMNADGSGQKRLSTGTGRYTTPVWSPTGEWIAFTKQTGDQFHIGVMHPDGSAERLLTTSYLDEGPAWSPNGQVLIFSRETPGGGPRLWTVDLNGHDQAAPYANPGSDPAWSPLLK